jgi:hypothetical protein
LSIVGRLREETLLIATDLAGRDCDGGPMNNLVLRLLTVVDEQAAREAHAELAAEGFEFLLDLRDNEPWRRTSTA